MIDNSHSAICPSIRKTLVCMDAFSGIDNDQNGHDKIYINIEAFFLFKLIDVITMMVAIMLRITS